MKTHIFHLATWKIIFEASKINLPPHPTNIPISVQLLGRLPLSRRNAWTSLSKTNELVGHLRDALWLFSSILAILLTIYMFFFLAKQFLISKSQDLSIVTVFFFGMQLFPGSVSGIGLFFTICSGDLKLNIRSYRWLHHKIKAFNKTTTEENESFHRGLRTTLILSGIFFITFPILGGVSPILTKSAPIHFLIQDCLDLTGLSPPQGFITFLAVLLGATVCGNWGLVGMNMCSYILWYLNVSVYLLTNLQSWTVRNLSSGKLLCPQTRRQRIWQRFRADTKFHLFCSLYSEARVGLGIFNDFVNHVLSACLFGGCGLCILSVYGAMRFFNKVHPVLWFMFIFGLVFVSYLISVLLPPACQIYQDSSKVLRAWRKFVKSKTAQRKVWSFQELKINFAPFFYGGRATTLTVVSVSIDMLVNLLLYKSSFD